MKGGLFFSMSDFKLKLFSGVLDKHCIVDTPSSAQSRFTRILVQTVRSARGSIHLPKANKSPTKKTNSITQF